MQKTINEWVVLSTLTLGCLQISTHRQQVLMQHTCQQCQPHLGFRPTSLIIKCPSIHFSFNPNPTLNARFYNNKKARI
jgi:hypothetical protein